MSKRLDFPGFYPPTYTPVPDELFDSVMAGLSGSELKVLLYIIRRTFGFKKDADTISFQQFRHGIRTHDGRQLDQGCGVKSYSQSKRSAPLRYWERRWRSGALASARPYAQATVLNEYV